MSQNLRLNLLSTISGGLAILPFSITGFVKSNELDILLERVDGKKNQAGREKNDDDDGG